MKVIYIKKKHIYKLGIYTKTTTKKREKEMKKNDKKPDRKVGIKIVYWIYMGYI